MMTSTEEYSKLCCSIVEDLYGTFLAQIFYHLTQYGRLSANQLAQRCHLPMRQIKTGLATLVQLRLVYHHTSPDTQSTYQANTHHAYNQFRTGKLTEIVDKKYGSIASKIVEILAICGFATAPELELSFEKERNGALSIHPPPVAHSEEKVVGALSNGINHPTITAFRAALRSLIENSYVVAVTKAQLHSSFDVRQDLERGYQTNIASGAAKTRKVQAEQYAETTKRLEQARGCQIVWKSVLQDLQLDNQISPRQELKVLRIDYSRIVSGIRCDTVAKIAEQVGGVPAAKVAYGVCAPIGEVSTLSHPSSDLDLEHSKMSKSLDRIQRDLRDFEGKVHSEQIDNGQLENGWRNSDQSNGFHVMDFSEICQHLRSLSDGPLPFLHQGASNDLWHVDKCQMARFLRDYEVFRLLGERVTGPALRIVRILTEKGKLDEKCLQEMGLLGAKELRQCLAEMQSMGFLELQEVPREAQRQPNRTIFLWFYDPDRVRNLLLGKLYKAMSRLFERLQLERKKLASTLNKIERSDVRGSEHDLLSAGELRVLDQWRRKESWFLAEVYRLDDSVALLETMLL